MVSVLRFSLFRMPVTVRGSFLVIAGLIGFLNIWDPVRGSISLEGVQIAAAWIAIIFVSILVHELGHAVTARIFGSQVAIELNGLGGLTRWSVDGSMTPGRRALVSAAGSAVGLLFGGLAWLVETQVGPESGFVAFVLGQLVFVNVFWGLLNWLPIRPLDGGHLLQSLLDKVVPKRADEVARVIFTVTAAAALAFGLWQGRLIIAALAGWLLLSEFALGREPQPRAGIPTLSYDEPAEDEVPGVPPRLESLEWSPSESSDEPSDPDDGEDEEH
jgi:stage IV sporulation protein FB